MIHLAGEKECRWTMDAGTDAVLAAIEAHPYRVARPVRWTAPFVFASPHSGRQYPPSFVAASRLSANFLRRSEDAYVDHLFESVTELGAPLLAAQFPRAYVDVNRAPGELDPHMYDAVLGVPVDAPSPRVAAGLGVIPRVVREGVDIYRGKLDPSDAATRLARLYRPYHAALAALVEESFEKFGCAVVVDCHSMPSVPATPMIVFGDCYGASASPALLRRAERAFAASGFSVARNAPYAGGYTTHFYARREAGIHALQIEVNRALYLDEDRVEPTGHFADVRARLAAALADMVTLDIVHLRPQQSLAAE